jgi:two-component system, OmpR family, response regulator CpxR
LAPAKASILCVDDENNALLMRKLVLERAGYEVITAVSAAEALQAIKSRPFDLVLADYVMPGFSGAELSHTVKGLYPETPVILISASNEIPADSSEADLFISKLEGPVKLVEAIAGMLSQRA